MPKPKKGPRFGGSPSHHKLIVGNLTTELFRHGRLETTLAKAKSVQPLADRMVTFAKRGDIHARRQVHRVIQDRDVVHKLFEDVGPAFAERQGGYTRVLKTGSRKGDAAAMALIELVEGADGGEDTSLTEAPRRRWSLRRRRGTVSQSAQARDEEFAAAEDRGETAEDVPVDDVDQFDADDAGADALAAPGTEDGDDEEGLALDPAEVERRLAEADETESTGQDEGSEPSEAEGRDADDDERP